MSDSVKKSVSFKETIESRAIDKMAPIKKTDIFHQSSSADRGVNYTLLTKDQTTPRFHFKIAVLSIHGNF